MPVSQQRDAAGAGTFTALDIASIGLPS